MVNPMEAKEDLSNYMTVNEVAELYGVSRTAVNYWLSAGHLPTYLDGKKKLIRVDDLENFERPATRKPGRPKGSRNKKKKKVSQKVTHLQPVGNGAAARRLQIDHGGRADEISSVLNTLGAALTEASFLIEKLDVETPENAKSEMLRSDLRAAQRLLRRSYDFLVDGENVTFKGEDKASDLARDVGRALRGT